MRKIYAALIACIFAVAAFSQDATFYKLPDGCPLVIDGVVDDVWAAVTAYNVDKPLALDTDPPTLDLCTWQAVWNDTAIMVLIIVEEDNWCPAWCSGANDWESDKPEVYFDVNDTLADGVGPSAQPNGHYQFAPGPTEGELELVVYADSWQGWWFGYGYVIDDPDETWEYSFLLEDITDHLGVSLDPTAIDTIGFDVTFIDRDEGDAGRKRMVWMQDATSAPVDEAWNNMDGAGKVVFSSDPVTGIYTKEVYDNISVYPNPAIDYLQIKADFNEAVITNIIGQEALILRDVKGTKIDISSLESGLYFISLYNNSKYIGTVKFTVR
jgi:hypothetical protein